MATAAGRCGRGVMSTEEMSETPEKERSTARSFAHVNCSMRSRTPRRRVKMLLVQERIVALATEVHFRQ